MKNNTLHNKIFKLITVIVIIGFLFFLIESCKENPTSDIEKSNIYNAKIVLSPKTVTGYRNQKIKFTVNLYPSDLKDKLHIVWRSIDSLIADVDQNGICHLKNFGQTYITGTLLSEKNEILAKDSSLLKVDSLSISIILRELSLAEGESYQLPLICGPFKIKWSSSDHSIAFVDSLGKIRVNELGVALIKGEVIDSSSSIIEKDSIKIYVEWKKLYSPQNKISSMAFNKSANTIIAGTEYSGDMYYSYDMGKTWSRRNNYLLQKQIINKIDISPQLSNIIYVTNISEGIFKSDDNGVSWRKIPNFNNYVVSIAIDPNNGQNIYALCRESELKVYKSTNSGENWELISTIVNPSGNIPGLFIDPLYSKDLYIGGQKSFHSSDGGIEWKEIKFIVKDPTFKLVGIDKRHRIYVEDYNWDEHLNLRLIRSADFGNNWDVLQEYPTSSYTYFTETEPFNVIFIESVSTLKISTDDGNSWETIQKPAGAGFGIGTVLINNNPFEMIHVSQHFIWKYKRAVQ